METGIRIVCPNCLGVLSSNGKRAACPKCSVDFAVKDGIPVLRQNPDTYYGEFPQGEMHKLLAASRTDLEGSLREYIRRRDASPRLGEYILGHGRAGWQYLLPVDRSSKVLDLGCGWGTLAWSLAQFCGHVVACDSTLERMQLLGIRRQLESVDNLQLVCAGDSKHLPFPDDSFNAVVVNGVLEWVPSGLPGDPRRVQMKFLREVRRVLQPDGCLFLGIENRYAWKTWAMNADGHTGLRFVPWLPRALADLYSRLNRRGGYRNYLYGSGQFRRLLSECGFNDTRFYVPCPGYHHPVRMIDFQDTRQLAQAFTRQEHTAFRRFRQKVKGVLSARFPDAFGMIASDQKRESFLERLLNYVRDTNGDNATSGPNNFSYRMNGEMGIVTVIVRAPGEPFVLKLPLHDRGLQELNSEAQILKQVHNHTDHPLADSVSLFARVRSDGEFGQQSFFTYCLLPGVSGDRISVASGMFTNIVHNAAEFLAQLHLRSPVLNTSLDELVSPVRDDVLSLTVGATQRDTVHRITDRVFDSFSSSVSGAVWGHGDSKLANFMFDPKTADLTGVIDWGTGFQAELPGYDLSFLLVSSEASRARTKLTDQLQSQYRNGPPQHSRDTLQKFVETCGLSLNDHQYQALIGYQWMKRLAPLAGEYETMRFNHRYLNSMFDAMT